ncbi:MAG: efflux RND transporter periplasmic adaptor subunit [Bacteroidales bacterium]|nr:efflux RND transporter periplasmic adaptor subunit [Bacteroidales bacterium]
MKRVINTFTFILLAVIGLQACNRTKNDENQKNTKPKVRVEQVYKQEVEQLYEYTATVQAEAVNNIAPTIPGRIDKIFVEVGDNVPKGKLLIQMDENNLLQAKSRLENLEATFKRLDELYKVGGISKSDWDAQKTNLDVARTAYEDLKKNTQLHSPISGVVSMRNYDAGDIYAGNPILQVQQIKPVKLLIHVSENMYTKVTKGMDVKVKVDVYGDEEFKGKVSLVYPTIDPRTHTFAVEITIQNSDAKIRPGMYARVTVNMGSENRILVPDGAIVKQQGSGERYVYVYKDGKVSYNRVVIGKIIDKSYELISGVENGDFVVTSGISRLNNGIEVELVK